MNRSHKLLAGRYAAAFRQYLAKSSERALNHAYELGRRAAARGVGVLDMARIHLQTLEELGNSDWAPEKWAGVLRASETFLLESLSPFEISHRGFRDAGLRLRESVRALEQRNRALSLVNQKFESEIHEHRRTEAALRESEDHFRNLYHRAETLQEDLRKLSNRILRVQEEERTRISRELHDELGQAMTAVIMNLTLLREAGSEIPPGISHRITDSEQLLRNTMTVIRRFAHELRPPILDDLGLVPALRSYVRDFAKRTGLQVELRATPAAEQLDRERKTVVFRVAQESLTNVAKHAHASQVKVIIRRTRQGIHLEIGDNGRAFRKQPASSPASCQHLGLLGMQERVRLVNGDFSIKSAPGKGTTVRVEIPFNRTPPPGATHRQTGHLIQSPIAFSPRNSHAVAP